MKTSQTHTSPPAPAVPPGERTWHAPSLGESGFRFRSKAAGCLAALFLAGIGSASAADDPDILFAMKIESLSSLNAGDPTGNRATDTPAGGSMVSLGSPTVVDVNGLKWEKNVYATGDGYRFVAPDVPGGVYNAPIPTNGVSVVAVVQPKYIGVAGEARGEIVDFFYSELYLAVSHSPANEGEVIVDRRGYLSENTGYKIPDGQKTILSLVVQPNGDMKLFANGVQKWSKSTGVDYTSLQQTGLSGGAKTITVGRNDYDGWSIFSGNIGDVYVYKKALDNTALTTLQNGLATKFSITLPQIFTITTTATNGTISPAGPYQAEQGLDHTFNFFATAGYVNVVTVDGQIQPGHPTSYTFTNVQANHSLNVTFTVEPPPANDNFAGAINLPGDSGTQSGTSNFAATLETGEPIIDLGTSTDTVWFKWTASTTGEFTVNTTGSTDNSANEWDAMLGVYTGPSLNALTKVAFQDTGLQEVMTIPVTAGTTYYIQAAGFDNDVASNILLNWSFVVPPPPNPFADWAGFYFTPGSPESAMGMDPDNDGMNNLQEYAFDEDPTTGANSVHMRTTIEDVGGEQALLLTVAVIDSAVFTGSPSLTATTGGVVYTIQGGNDLSGFNQTVTEVTPARSTGMLEPFGGWEYRTFRLSGPISAHPAGFLRIRTAPAP